MYWSFTSLMRKSLLILCLLFNLDGFSQEEFFSEVSVGKTVFTKNSWVIYLEGNYKHAFQDSKWRRLGLDIGLSKELNSNWTLLAKLTNQYRFDNELGDFYELRPTVGIQLQVPIVKNLTLKQRVLGEWRNFYVSSHDHYLRARYRTGVNYEFGKRGNSSKTWSLTSSFEWYFLRDPILRERYSNSREFSLFISRNLEDAKFMVGYIREVFLLNSDSFDIYLNYGNNSISIN